jgi:hypothetical protein
MISLNKLLSWSSGMLVSFSMSASSVVFHNNLQQRNAPWIAWLYWRTRWLLGPHITVKEKTYLFEYILYINGTGFFTTRYYVALHSWMFKF